MRKRVHHDWPWHTADRFEHRLRKVRTHVHPPVTNVELHVGLVACCVTKPAQGEPNEFAVEKARRIVPLDRARSFITLLVVLHHPLINYTCFGHADAMRWLRPDRVVSPTASSWPDVSYVRLVRGGQPSTVEST
jgi:hypothetical protein